MLRICEKLAQVEGKLVRVARLDAEGYDFVDDPEVAIADVRGLRRRVDIFTFIRRVADAEPGYPFHVEMDNMAVLRVTTHQDWMKNQLDFKARNKVRKALKAGVTVREVEFGDELLKGISAIYNETPIRQGRKFHHYGRDLESLRRIKRTFLDRSIFLGAYFEGRLIGFAKLVRDEIGSQAGLMHILSMLQHRDRAPTNALISQAVQSCADRGIPNLWYAKFSYGSRQTDSLAEFKRHNGFEKVEVPRYYVPLNALGALALRFGLHHSAADWIPESFSIAYRSARKHWYSKRISQPGNA